MYWNACTMNSSELMAQIVRAKVIYKLKVKVYPKFDPRPVPDTFYQPLFLYYSCISPSQRPLAHGKAE